MELIFLQFIVGPLLLAEVSGRIFGWTYLTDYTYRICRPFWIPFPMIIGVTITFVETIVGAILTYRGGLELIMSL